MVSTPLSLGEGLGVRCLDNSYIKNNYFAVSPKKKSPWIGALLSGRRAGLVEQGVELGIGRLGLLAVGAVAERHVGQQLVSAAADA